MGSGDHLKKGGGGGPGRRVAEGNEVGRVRVFLQTGSNALAHVQQLESALAGVAGTLKVSPAEVPARVGVVLEQMRALEKELAALKGRLAYSSADSEANPAVLAMQIERRGNGFGATAVLPYATGSRDNGGLIYQGPFIW
jgi:alanyl-tRNA synthetase